MEDTEAGHLNPDYHDAHDDTSVPLSDFENFCRGSKELFVSLKPTKVRLHDHVSQFKSCGEQCKFCRVAYDAFGPNWIDYHMRGRKIEAGEVLHVEGALEELHMGERTKMLEKATVLIILTADEDKWVDQQRFIVLANGGMYCTTCKSSIIILTKSARGMERGIWRCPNPVTFLDRVSTLEGWLKECCFGDHPKCRGTLVSDAPRAARLLEVFTDNGRHSLRLVSTGDLPQDTRYIALSHCWGGVAINSKTTRENVEAYFISIDIEMIPKTFQESVHITRALGIRYLWIDSLCIIQHDEDDWQREAAKMANVFRSAILTISATSAENSAQGCGIAYPVRPSTQFSLPRPNASAPSQLYMRQVDRGVPRYEYLDSGRDRLFRKYPVHNRTWIFQEEILSRRILHTTHGLFIWQCATHVESEDAILSSNHSGEWGQTWRPLRSHIPDVSITGRTWWDLVRDFTHRALTKLDDNYAAIAGVIELYREITGDSPVLGLWRNDLILHLAWEAQYQRNSGHIFSPSGGFEAAKRRPSWTWMSYPHGSVDPWPHLEVTYVSKFSTPGNSANEIRRFPPLPRFPPVLCYTAEVIDVKIVWEGRPLVSTPASGVLWLRGLNHTMPVPPEANFTSAQDFVLDPGMKYGTGTTYYFFALFANNFPNGYAGDGPQVLHTVSLIMEALEPGLNLYRRVGLFFSSDFIVPPRTLEDVLVGTYQEIALI